MSNPSPSERSSPRRYDDVLGYLLKHAHLALEARTDAALGPLGVTSRDMGVLRVIVEGEARSQQEVAAVLGVDRTSMVALLDTLEREGIVARHPSEQDRRRNVIELTEAGRKVFTEAERASLAVEREFVGSLGVDGANELRAALRSLLAATSQ
ncbi:MarR family winged helix-turn-helix transcriptional regulator [Leifsonia aquatica]|uniref:MarR family winged helix-turn-helix transcriptional regulator n=1 Tax=Leifsonia aquatica TaxID=144185 RepID=UPI0028AECA88|nr:MarR family transcriptional regulator [Leifsonia aquatica]